MMWVNNEIETTRIESGLDETIVGGYNSARFRHNRKNSLAERW
jgi:hypothetical protein